MKYILLITLFALGGCGRGENEYPKFPANGWYTIIKGEVQNDNA